MSEAATARRFVPGTQIEIVRDVPLGRFKHALFDFDGTISLLREGWQAIMAPVMLEMICGDSTPTGAIREDVERFIDETTGIQTLIQMQGLVDMVRKYGHVPPGRMLDAAGYKAVYNHRLMGPVNERLSRLAAGTLRRDDSVVLGSPEFLEGLAARGLAMYIFSGTDQDDVRNEAARLGTADYFREIWGALPSIEEFSKEKVLKQIIATHNLHGAEVLIVGDGPVEIRNAKENGCVALGVASNETLGHGWDEVKRRRLISAGADLVVPDFGECSDLLAYLFPA